MIHAAKIMAATAAEAIADEALLSRAKAEFAERTARTPYVCPMPPEVVPPLLPRPVKAA